MSDDYGSWKCIKLKVELAKRGARTTGTKLVLVERLRAYDRNHDFSSVNTFQDLPEELPMPDWPNSVVFKTITAEHRESLPPILSEHINQYVIHRQAADHQSIGDLKAIQKGKLVAEDSVAALSTFQDENFTFLSGTVNASMKKRLSYSVKLVIQQSGEIRNSHCECPGGMGPHGTCKHVVAVLLVVSDFKTTGKVTISKSCTETLQSFNRPKQAHNGSPVKAENLGSKLEEEDDDPRPAHLRNLPGYSDQVLMKVVNFSYYSGIDIAFRYMGPKADMTSASRDHDYLKCDFREH